MDTKAIGKILNPRFDAVSGDGARALKELGLPADAAILDVGTGNGYFAIYLASQGYRVLTGEPSTESLCFLCPERKCFESIGYRHVHDICDVLAANHISLRIAWLLVPARDRQLRD
jgi:hypothetical protein